MKLLITILILTGIAAATCGKERWPVKTLNDKDFNLVDMLNITDTSVHELVKATALPRLRLQRAVSNRIAWEEKKQFRFSALILGAKLESDEDFHIVIADPGTKETMIIEIPSSTCINQAYKVMIQDLRNKVEARMGKITSTYKKEKNPISTIVTGIGFYDFIHGQTGVAKNGFELHPLLKIEFSPIDCEVEKEKCQ